MARRILSSPIGTTNQEARERWLEARLKEIPAGSKILDAGAGELQYKRFCSHLDYTSQDFGAYDGVGDRVGMQMGTWDTSGIDIASDITSIPVEAESFDAVMCVEVLEHVPRPIDALAEFARILRSGGALIVTTPVSSLTHFAPYYFYNGFSRYFYEHALATIGFEIVELSFNGNFYESLAQEIRRVPSVGRDYSPEARRFPLLWRVVSRLALLRLDHLSAHDRGSSELLCHGIHVVARRS